jgi:hypothetical protein
LSIANRRGSTGTEASGTLIVTESDFGRQTSLGSQQFQKSVKRDEASSKNTSINEVEALRNVYFKFFHAKDSGGKNKDDA